MRAWESESVLACEQEERERERESPAHSALSVEPHVGLDLRLLR